MLLVLETSVYMAAWISSFLPSFLPCNNTNSVHPTTMIHMVV
jgi:hypothetical protein